MHGYKAEIYAIFSWATFPYESLCKHVVMYLVVDIINMQNAVNTAFLIKKI